MKKTNFLCAFLFGILFLGSSTKSISQFNNQPTLFIDDPAPAVKVQQWLRGDSISAFRKGEVYVIDFWATWCGGCILSFPHISGVAEKYKGKVRFISIDSYEEIGENKGKDPVAMVKEFLKTPQGQKLTIDVAVDGPAKGMYNAWVKPLRRQGFPTTFVIDQEGKIAWIDVNLDHLAWVLAQVLAGKWDRKKAAEVMKKKDAMEDKLFALLGKQGRDLSVVKPELKNEYESLLADCMAFEKKFPDRKDVSAFYKVIALTLLDKSKVPSVLDEMAVNPLSRYINLADAAGLTLMRNDLTKADYFAVAKVKERCLLNEYPVPGRDGESIEAYKSLADVYQNAGDLANAKRAMERAIEFAKMENASSETIADLEAKLKELFAE